MLHKKMRLFFILMSLGIISSLVSPAQAVVIASVKPVGFIAAAIADGVTSVEILLPDGVSEHDYSLRPSDIKRLHNADLVTWVGPEIEIFMSKYALRLPPQKNIEIDSLPGVKRLLLKNTEENYGMYVHDEDGGHEYQYHSDYNMHLWMSPQIAQKTVIAIHAKLLELMPQKKNKLDANLLHFKTALSSVDAKIGNQLAPVKDKGYFVFHDAYTYFEKHFGLRPLGHFTVNPAIQPGAQRLHQIRTQLAKRKATCIFAEPQFRSSAIEAVSRGIAVRSGTLDPLGMNITLSKDSYMTFLSQLSSQYVSCLKEE